MHTKSSLWAHTASQYQSSDEIFIPNGVCVCTLHAYAKKK